MIEGRKILFREDDHSYTDEYNNDYTSVTTLIGKYVPAFNKRYWSMYVALRDSGFRVKPTDAQQGIIVDGSYRDLEDLYLHPINSHEVGIVVNKWKKMTKDACDRGNKIHDFLEDTINISKDDYKGETNKLITPSLSHTGEHEMVIIRTKHDLDKTRIQDVYPSIYSTLLSYVDKGCTLFAEKLVYSPFYLVAGKIDVLVVKDKHFAILDWKTNKDVMLFNSGYFKKKVIGGVRVKTDEFVRKEEYLKFPINTVENCKGMVYSLQVSLYAMLLIMWGYKLVPNGLGIYHIRLNCKPKYIPIKFMYNEVQALLKDHYEKKSNVLQCNTNELRKKSDAKKFGIW
jgi:hypothetical protein